jgi:tetratricopeptide (TPR) repeat protein
LVGTLVISGVCCTQRPHDPVAVARRYFEVGQTCTKAGLKKRYALLSADSRKVASLGEYFQYYSDTARGTGTRWTIDSIDILPDDKNLPTYRRVRLVEHRAKDSLRTPGVLYYTFANENGLWSVVWEMALLDQARDLLMKGMLDEAIGLCDKALALNPYSAVAYDWKAWCYDRKGAPDHEARQARKVAIETNAKKAVALEPEDPGHYNTLSLAYRAQDLPELQIECYRKAIGLPTCKKARKVVYYANISGTYAGMSKWRKATAFADSALAIDSADAFALMKKAEAELALEHADSAKSCLDRALAANWETQLDKGLQFHLFYLVALSDEKSHEYDQARENVLKALEMDPSDARAQALYSRVKRKSK